MTIYLVFADDYVSEKPEIWAKVGKNSIQTVYSSVFIKNLNFQAVKNVSN